MNILVLKSSGNRSGSSNTLADAFIRGAKEGGHAITEYDVFRADMTKRSPYLQKAYELGRSLSD